MTESSNEFNRYEEISEKTMEDYLYGNKENTDELKYNWITDSGDINDLVNNHQSTSKSHLSINSLLKQDEHSELHPTFDTTNILEKKESEENLILSEKIDLKDLNPYESPSSSIDIVSENDQINYQPSLVDINPGTTSTSLVLPQSVQNHINSPNSFQQLWSSRVYSPKLIDSKISKNTLSILTMMKFPSLYSCTKILKYDPVLFGCCYVLGALFGMHAYFFIDFLLMLTCIISILVATYEKWLFNYINLNEFESQLNTNENENRYRRPIKVAAYGFGIGILSTFFV